MVDVDYLEKLASIACDAAIASGAEFADVSSVVGRSLRVDLESNAIKSCSSQQVGSIAVRAIVAGGTGWSTSDKLSEESAVEAGKNAAALAKLAEPDPDFKSLPAPAEYYPDVKGLYDPQLASFDARHIIDYALANIDEALAVCPDVNCEGGFSVNYYQESFANSLGILLTDISSHIGGHIMAIVKRDGDVGSFYEFDSGRVLADFEPNGIGASAARQAMQFLGARKLQTKRMPIILGPLASRSVFEAIVSAADAEDIQRGRSFLIGKLGEKIASDAVTIGDDPLIARGLGSRRHDGEGVPCRPMVIMENGVLKSYLFSTYTAGKAGVPPTGHGTRGGSASPSNIVPGLGTKTAAELIAETQDGLYINIGAIEPDQTTGDVSATVDFGFKIENGELAYPVTGTMIGGSFLELLANVDAVSSDYRYEPGTIMPTVRIQDVLVAGGK